MYVRVCVFVCVCVCVCICVCVCVFECVYVVFRVRLVPIRSYICKPSPQLMSFQERIGRHIGGGVTLLDDV